MKNCFDNIKIAGLSESFKSKVKEGMTDEEIRDIGTAIALEHYDKLSDALVKLKKNTGIKNVTKQTANKKEVEKKQVEEEYKEKKKKTSAKETINYKQKKLRQAVNALGAPTDARTAALAYFSGEGKISPESLISDVVNTRKTRDGKRGSAEIHARDYIDKLGDSVDGAAHGIWESLDEGLKERITDQDVKNALIDVMGEFNRRNDIREHYLDKYGDVSERALDEEQIEELNKLYDEEIADIAKGEEAYADDQKKLEDEFSESEEYINHYIDYYNEHDTRTGQENQGKDSQNATGGKEKVNQETSNGKTDKKSEQPTKRVRDYSDQFALKGEKPETIMHFNQGEQFESVTILADPKVKVDYSEKSQRWKRVSGGSGGGFKHILKDIAKAVRDRNMAKIVDLKGVDLSKPLDEILSEINGKETSSDKIVNESISVGKNQNTLEQYVAKATAVLNQLFQEHKINTYNTTAEYVEATGRSKTSAGVYNRETKTISLNLELIKQHKAENTVFHEVIHPIVEHTLEKNENALDEAYQKIYDIASDPEIDKVWDHAYLYQGRGGLTIKIEAITEFLTKVADGTINPDKVSKSLSTRILEVLNQIFKKLGIAKQFNTASDLRVLADSIKKSFDTADASSIKEVMGEIKASTGKGEFDALVGEQRKKIEELIKRFPDESKESLIEKFKKHIPEEEASEIIDSVRGTKPPTPPSKGKGNFGVKGNDELTSIRLEDTAISREEFGLPEYEKNVESEEIWKAQADAALRKGYDVTELITKMQSGEYIPKAFEQVILGKQKIALEMELEENPTPENLAKFKAFVDATDKIAGSDVGKSLRARRIMLGRGDSLGDRMYEEMRSLGVEVLTEKQMSDVGIEFKKEKQLVKDIQEEEDKTQAEASKKKAKNTVDNMKKASTRKKKSEERNAEKKSILEEIKRKWSRPSDKMMSTVLPVPYAAKLIEIAPDVSKYVKILVEEGMDNLHDIIKEIHGGLKDGIPDITEKDVQDIIAGEYNKKPNTRNELTAKKRDLELEAKLLNELHDLENGTTKDKPEKEKIKDNQKIAELKKKIKDLTKKDPHQYEEAYMTRMQKQIDAITEELKQDVITNPEPKVPMPLSEKGKALKKELVELKRQRKIRLLKQEFSNQSTWKKVWAYAMKVYNIPRTLQSSFDLSSVLRQGIIPTLSHPKMAFEAGKKMISALKSQSSFDEFYHDLKEKDPRYEIMMKSKLPITDIDNPYLAAREEAFMGGGIIENLPKELLIGEGVKASERAYVMYLNKMRVDLFNMFAEQFEAKGKTYDNSKELYHDMAKYIGNATGRGHLGAIESWGPVLNVLLYSPRLIASRVNMLSPVYFARLPRELKWAMFKDMGTFFTIALTVVGLFKAYGATQDDDDPEKISVDFDPRSSDFLKIKQGRTRYDIFGGFQQYLRAGTQMAVGQKKNIQTGEIKEIDGEGAFGESRATVGVKFIRNKLSPIPATMVDFYTGKTAIGEEATIGLELKNKLPLTPTGAYESYDDGGIKTSAKVFITSMLGIGTSTYDPPKPQKEKGPDIYNKSTHSVRKPTKEEYAEYEKLKEQYYQEELENMKKDGVFEDSYGELTTNRRKAVSQVAPDSLSEEDYKEIQGRLKAKATRRAKEKMFHKNGESTTK
jgi:hypothetical protein